ncbi:MAG: hypothetical protein ABIQ57_16420 [Candidatus Kapaibacterium sp.]
MFSVRHVSYIESRNLFLVAITTNGVEPLVGDYLSVARNNHRFQILGVEFPPAKPQAEEIRGVALQPTTGNAEIREGDLLIVLPLDEGVESSETKA